MNVKARSFGYFILACLGPPTSSTDSCLGLSCGRATLGQLLGDMSCIVNNNYSKKIITYIK